MIRVLSVTFASSVNIGKNNHELTSIDPSRPEHTQYKMVFDGTLLWIIDTSKELMANDMLKRRRFTAIGTPNIRSMKMEKVTGEIIDFLFPKDKEEKPKK